MKKYLFMALAAFAFVSCSSDFEANEGAVKGAKGEPISFDVYAGAASRGSLIDNVDSLKKSDVGFTVWASVGGSEAFTETVSWDGSESAWTGTGHNYWPGGSVKFYFLAPSTIATNSQIITQSDKVAGTARYALPTTVANQIDVLYGDPVTQSSGTVNASFSHATSRITFAVKPGAGVDGNGVVVSAISVTGTFVTAGTMNFNASGDDPFWTETATGSSTFSLSPSSSSVSGTSAFTNIIPLNGDMFIIPCTVTDLTIQVTFSANQKAYTKSINMEQTFAKGQYYQINMTLGLDEITYGVTSVEGWGTATGV